MVRYFGSIEGVHTFSVDSVSFNLSIEEVERMKDLCDEILFESSVMLYNEYSQTTKEETVNEQ